MSLFEDPRYEWRETYFVLFDRQRRPQAKQVEEALRHVKDSFELSGIAADEDGMFESVTVIAHADFSALDIGYIDDEEDMEETRALVKDLQDAASDAQDRARLKKLHDYSARFDIMHFEEVVLDADDDEGGGMFDPTALLLVMKALAKMTHGVAVDPQSGTVV